MYYYAHLRQRPSNQSYKHYLAYLSLKEKHGQSATDQTQLSPNKNSNQPVKAMLPYSCSDKTDSKLSLIINERYEWHQKVAKVKKPWESWSEIKRRRLTTALEKTTRRLLMLDGGYLTEFCCRNSSSFKDEEFEFLQNFVYESMPSFFDSLLPENFKEDVKLLTNQEKNELIPFITSLKKGVCHKVDCTEYKKKAVKKKNLRDKIALTEIKYSRKEQYLEKKAQVATKTLNSIRCNKFVWDGAKASAPTSAIMIPGYLFQHKLIRLQQWLLSWQLEIEKEMRTQGNSESQSYWDYLTSASTWSPVSILAQKCWNFLLSRGGDILDVLSELGLFGMVLLALLFWAAFFTLIQFAQTKVSPFTGIETRPYDDTELGKAVVNAVLQANATPQTTLRRRRNQLRLENTTPIFTQIPTTTSLAITNGDQHEDQEEEDELEI